jgi:hypothetical protein
MKKNTFLLILLASLNIFAQNDLNNGLVGYYKFNGNCNDESNLGINGMLDNVSPTWGIEGVNNTAYYFSGMDSKITCGTQQRNITNAVTISAWVKTNASTYGFIVGKYDWRHNVGFHLAMAANGTVFLGGKDGGRQYNSAVSSAIVNDGEWHHVLGVITGNKWEIWVDGKLEALTSTKSKHPTLVSNEPLTIGYYHMGEGNGNHRHFQGVIDEVRIYNRALNNSEISMLFNKKDFQ